MIMHKDISWTRVPCRDAGRGLNLQNEYILYAIERWRRAIKEIIHLKAKISAFDHARDCSTDSHQDILATVSSSPSDRTPHSASWVGMGLYFYVGVTSMDKPKHSAVPCSEKWQSQAMLPERSAPDSERRRPRAQRRR